MNEHAFLRIENLSKRYGDFKAVDQISFTVQKGEIFGLLGPNGAGKTTTIRMLCGLLKSDGGNIWMNEMPLDASYKSMKHKIGLCPQDIVIWELLTCMEQLKFVGISYGMSPKEAMKRSGKLLESLGLTDKASKLAKTLSGGMQRRLNIALALVHDPELIILDEPQAGLDPQSRILVRDFIRNLSKNKTVILTTHDMDEADRLSDRIAIIDNGKILKIDTPERLKVESGAGDVLQVRVDLVTKDIVNQVLKDLSNYFTEYKYRDGFLFLEARDLSKQIEIVNDLLSKYDVRAEDMTIRKRTLEDAFIAMTGRGLRE